jgi:hypothetical protein
MMRVNALQALADELAADRRVSADEALRLRQQIFPDGVVSREEVEALMELDSRVAGSDPAWASAFVEAVSDHVLNRGQFPGHVDATTAGWLMAQFGDDGARETEVEALLKIIERAESVPDALIDFTHARLVTLMKGKAISAADVELMRRCVYAQDVWVSDDEARWLFQMDAESDGRANDPAWMDFFVKAVLNHLMGRQPSSLLNAEDMQHRQAWLADTRVRPFSNLKRIFEGGVEGYKEHVRELAPVDGEETYYEAANANAEEDAELTMMERAWALGMTKADGKLTANEKALLAELEKVASPAV